MTTRTTQTTATLAESLGAAEAALNALLKEQAELPDKIRQAAQEADAEQLVSLRERADRLPTHIAAARVRAVRLRVSLLEAEHDEAQAEAAPLVRRSGETAAALTAARHAHEAAVGASGNAQAHAQSVGMDLAQARRELAELEAGMAAPHRPVLRSALRSPMAAAAN